MTGKIISEYYTGGGVMPNKKPQVDNRLAMALKYLQLAYTSRELAYGAIPYVIAAERLIQLAQTEQQVENA